MKYSKSDFLKLPKADVHNHFHLGGSQDLFLKKYSKANLSFPNKYDGLTGMIDFIYNHLNKSLTTGEDVINFMEISIQSAINDNITLLEASVDTNLARFFNGDVNAVLKEVERIIKENKHKIDFKPDIGVNKDLPIDKVYEYGEAFINSGLFNGIDIYGQEANQNLEPFKELFSLAKENNIKTKAHIGEFSDYKSIEETITLLEPDELQHGINAINSERTIDMISERNIRLNICPQSNISLGAVDSFEKHPIRQLFDKGIKVTVNTDDLILFGATVTDELYNLYNRNIFSWDEINEIRNNAF